MFQKEKRSQQCNYTHDLSRRQRAPGEHRPAYVASEKLQHHAPASHEKQIPGGATGKANSRQQHNANAKQPKRLHKLNREDMTAAICQRGWRPIWIYKTKRSRYWLPKAASTKKAPDTSKRLGYGNGWQEKIQQKPTIKPEQPRIHQPKADASRQPSVECHADCCMIRAKCTPTESDVGQARGEHACNQGEWYRLQYQVFLLPPYAQAT